MHQKEINKMIIVSDSEKLETSVWSPLGALWQNPLYHWALVEVIQPFHLPHKVPEPQSELQVSLIALHSNVGSQSKLANLAQGRGHPHWPLELVSWQSLAAPQEPSVTLLKHTIFSSCLSRFLFHLAIKLSLFLLNTSSLDLKAISFY